MTEKPDRKIRQPEWSSWLDGGESDEDSPREVSVEPKELASELVIHGLITEMATRDVADEERRIANVLEEIDSVTFPSRKLLSGFRWLSGILAACLLIAIGVVTFKSTEQGPQITNDSSQPLSDETFASVAHVSGDDSGQATAFRKGDRLKAQTIQLESGFLRLTFDDGVDVTLQGPAEYELIKPGKTKLTSGLLTATVPAGAEGFTVDTPTAEVVDLGTSFGVDLRDNGASHVSVFEGEVEVFTSDAAESRLLHVGDAVRIESGEPIESVDFDPQPFTKVWPIASGIERSTDAFEFVPPWPPHRFIHSDEDIFIEPEGRGTELRQPLSLNISGPGEYKTLDELTPTEVAPGKRVRCFQAFFHPEQNVPLRSRKTVTGSITFDSPVLGVIVLEDELQATARRFSRKGPRDIRKNRQLEFTGDDSGDVVTLSDDRRTVTLTLKTPSRFAELLRIIVDASQPPSALPTNQQGKL